MEYIPKLDGIRTIAVFLVIVSHYFDFGEKFDFGYLGVNLFFFLSGYLITSLMVRDKRKIEMGELSRKHAIGNFYIRRSLRIFPLYYLVLLFMYIAGSKSGTHIREDIGYYFFYISNINFYWNQSWDGILSHFWSLSVEEQFYLFWPFIFFFSPRRLLPVILLLVAVSSVGTKIYLMPNDGSIFYHILLSTCAYKFCLGALLVLRKDWDKASFISNPIIAHIWMVVFALAYVFACLNPFRFNWVVKDLAGYAFFVYLLRYARYIGSGFWHHFLSNALVARLGLISYGLYVYHLIVPWVVSNAVNKVGMSGKLEAVHLFYPVCILATILLSYISYYYFEIYFLRLKSRFTTEGSVIKKKILI